MTRDMMERYMRIALEEARLAGEAGDVPVGACIVAGDRLLARGRNRRQLTGDPLAHAEVEALRAAAQASGGWNLSEATLFVTLEPCPMCAGALMQARIAHVVFGAYDGRAGCCGTLYNLPEDGRFPWRARATGGVLRAECAQLLTGFFHARREEPRIY